MRNLIFIFLSFAFVSLKGSESLPSGFVITKTYKQKGLSNKQAVFKFHFSAQMHYNVSTKIRFSYNGKESTIQPDKQSNYVLKISPGKYKFEFYMDEGRYEEIFTDSVVIKPANRIEANVYFVLANRPVMVKKPVIYFYPQQEQKVDIKLAVKGDLKFTYPTYNNGWSFTAKPNGDLKFGDKTYNYIFWDAEADLKTDAEISNKGYQVKRDSLLSFFEEKLTAMNLNIKEIQDYITYWVPQMNKADNYYIHFLFNNEFSKYAALDIQPKPDNLFRVFMLMKPLDSEVDLHLNPQVIQKVNRSGFTVVEWGGSDISSKIEVTN